MPRICTYLHGSSDWFTNSNPFRMSIYNFPLESGDATSKLHLKMFLTGSQYIAVGRAQVIKELIINIDTVISRRQF